MNQANWVTKLAAISLAATILLFVGRTARAQSDKVGVDDSITPAICPIVVPLDAFPTEQGYHYFFYGNAFFINEQGYLITAAHVLSSFRNGGVPHVLVGAPGERRFLEAPIVAADWEHDVAVLRATPNPFAGEKRPRVGYLALTLDRQAPGSAVQAVSLRPTDLQSSHTSEEPNEERSHAQVVDYEFTREESAPRADDANVKVKDSEVLLFNQKVSPGQSGSPLLSEESRGVTGIVVGQWQRPVVLHSSATGQSLVMAPGAALNIHYAISLLRANGIAWHPAAIAALPQAPAQQAPTFVPAGLVSLVTTPYPPQALFGGEVVLDAQIDAGGKIGDLTVISGNNPFVGPVLDAVRTWTFSPARLGETAVASRIAIVFQFPQSFFPKLPAPARDRSYESITDRSAAHGPLPAYTDEPDYPANTVAEDSVALYGEIDSQGALVSTRVLRDVEPLTDASLAAFRRWRFASPKQAGPDGADSAVIAVFTFRHP